MTAMKRVNLKAKKQVFAPGKNALKKGPSTRWEDVDPIEVSYFINMLINVF